VNKLSRDNGSRKYITLGEYRAKQKAKRKAKKKPANGKMK